MPFIFDSRATRYKKPFGPASVGEKIQFTIFLPHTPEYYAPSLVVYDADNWEAPHVFPMNFKKSYDDANSYRCEVAFEHPALMFYHFTICTPNGEINLVRGDDGVGYMSPNRDAMWQLTVYNKEYKTPEFLNSGIIYQIFPDRFNRSKLPDPNIFPERKIHENWSDMPDYLPNERGEITNSDYFGGNFDGIIEKLDYLESLSVSCIYLNPVFEAHSNHRYNTANYMKIDPFIGDDESFARLCKEADKHGIKVILDGVFNHTGDDSIYFNRYGRYNSLGAYQSKDSPYYNWYDFDENDREKYRCWWGFKTLPEVNEHNEDFQNYIFGKDGVIEHWMNLGAYGFRLDVADELPDYFLDALTAKVKSINPDAIVIGEVWEDASNKISYSQRRRYLQGKQLDSVMNYPFKNAILKYITDGTGKDFYESILTILENYPRHIRNNLMNSLSTHDTERVLTLLSTSENVNDRRWQADHHFIPPELLDKGIKRMKLAMSLQYFLPGVPCLYYGDEAGMSGYRDPFNRCTYPWGAENGEILSFAQQLGRIRKNFPWIAEADFIPVMFWNSVCVFIRNFENKELLIMINRTDSPVRVDMPDDFYNGTVIMGAYNINEKVIEPYSTVIIYAEKEAH